MIEKNEVNIIKEIIQEFLDKMTVKLLDIALESVSGQILDLPIPDNSVEKKDTITINITVEDPQILIGQQGQTLFELQRLIRIILHKKFQKDFYINLDINDYKKKKIEYLRNLAQDVADQVVYSKEKKVLSPMPSYERRIIHAELSGRSDIVTESQGEGFERCIVISPA